MDVGREDLHIQRCPSGRQMLVNQHRHRIRFFPRGTTRDPDSEFTPRCRAGQQRRNHVSLQTLKRLLVPKELRDADQQVAVQGMQFCRVVAQSPYVLGQIVRPVQPQPPLQTAAHRGRSVMAEIDAEFVLQEPKHDVHVSVRAHRHEFRRQDQRRSVFGEVLQDRPRHFIGRQHGIHRPGFHGAARHPVESGGLLALSDDQAALFVNRQQSARTVAAGSRENDRRGLPSGILGQGTEKHVDRHRQSLARVPFRQMEAASGDNHLRLGGNQVDGIRLDLQPLLDAMHGHRRMPGQQLVHQALEVRREMLDHHKGQPGVRRQGVEKRLQSLQPARRGTDAHDASRASEARGRRSDRCWRLPVPQRALVAVRLPWEFSSLSFSVFAGRQAGRTSGCART